MKIIIIFSKIFYIDLTKILLQEVINYEKKKIIVGFLLVSTILTGCSSGFVRPEGSTSYTAGGALSGAAAGALAGQVIGGDTKGTLIGAAAGASWNCCWFFYAKTRK